MNKLVIAAMIMSEGYVAYPDYNPSTMEVTDIKLIGDDDVTVHISETEFNQLLELFPLPELVELPTLNSMEEEKAIIDAQDYMP